MAAGMLLAAEEVFADSGLGKAHVDEIARRAGVAVGTLYNYYKDRDALLYAVLTSRIDELTREYDAVLARSGEKPVREILRELARAKIRFTRRHRSFIRILYEGELTQLTEAYPTSALVPTTCWRSFRDRFAGVLARGVASGELRAEHVEIDVWLFLGMLRGVAMRDLRDGVPCTEADADRVVDVFFDGARAR